jgi:5'-phosphate synthase pdxT subunit
MAITIGVLSLQGGFSKHAEILDLLNVAHKEIRLVSELKSIDALILPGGESTTIIKLMQSYNFLEAIKDFAKNKAVFGTCAGSILMASKIENFPFPSLNLIDMTVIRNAYGRQIDSFHANFQFNHENCEALFIRAPKFKDMTKDLEQLAFFNNECIAVKQGKHLAISCHPELLAETKIHKYFIEHCMKANS